MFFFFKFIISVDYYYPITLTTAGFNPFGPHGWGSTRYTSWSGSFYLGGFSVIDTETPVKNYASLFPHSGYTFNILIG